MANIHKYNTFLLNENIKKSFDDNRRIIRSYIKCIRKSDLYSKRNKKDEDGYVYNTYDTWIDFLTILHNYLHVEEKFEKEVKLNNKQINKYLELPKTNDFNTIIQICEKYYDNDSKVRFGLETLDSIQEVRDYLDELRSKVNFYHKIQIKPYTLK